MAVSWWERKRRAWESERKTWTERAEVLAYCWREVFFYCLCVVFDSIWFMKVSRGHYLPRAWRFDWPMLLVQRNLSTVSVRLPCASEGENGWRCRSTQHVLSSDVSSSEFRCYPGFVWTSLPTAERQRHLTPLSLMAGRGSPSPKAWWIPSQYNGSIAALETMTKNGDNLWGFVVAFDNPLYSTCHKSL